MSPKYIMKLNQIILIGSILIIIAWITMKSRRIENLDPNASDLVLYIESREEPNPFIAHDMSKKITSDENILKKVLMLASEKKKAELLTLARTL